ncbi:MAG: hypothetical protein AB7O62_00015 [Pirellulales bacterium]
MNYLAHALSHLDEPYVLAGTAVPDWLNVADRQVRVRSKHALPFVADADERLAAVARGVVRHHADDAWFHETAVFHELCWRFTVEIRDRLPPDEGFRPSFLGHILVEILLDATLIADSPALLESYYRAAAQVDGRVVQEAVNRMAPRRTERLAPLIPHFHAAGFLWDYLDDQKLLRRLNQVMDRVRLPALPPDFCGFLPAARRTIGDRQAELLAQPAAL